MARNFPGPKYNLPSTVNDFMHYRSGNKNLGSQGPIGITGTNFRYYKPNFSQDAIDAMYYPVPIAQHTSDAINAGLAGGGFNIPKGASKEALNAIKSMAPVLDAAFMPPSTKVQGTYSTDTIASTLDIALTLFQVDDIDEVARIYESNGYAVSIYTQSNPIRQQHNRQLYDYLQCDDVNVNGIMDGQLLEDFIARIKNGLRLWHTDGNGNLICTSAPFGVRLGVLCVRDNTEV